MEIKFIETVCVKSIDGKFVITPFSLESMIKKKEEEEVKEKIKEEGLYYRYYNEFYKGFVLIPFVNSRFYKFNGYEYEDKKLIEYFKAEKEKEKGKREIRNRCNSVS